jgi:hypothetical protein
MTFFLTFLFSLLPALEAQNFKYGGLSFASSERDVQQLYPNARRISEGGRTKYTCCTGASVFTVDFVHGQVNGFVNTEFRPGLDVQARRQQLQQQFGPALCKDEAKASELWLFPQVHRGVYHKVTADAAYLIVDKR